jgi:hypothetical protein
MAIVPTLPGLVVTIEVVGNALPKFDYGAANDVDLQTMAKYIEALAGAEFEIRYVYNPHYNPTSIAQLDVVMDGDYVQAPYVEWGGKDGCEGYKCGRATFFDEQGMTTRSFRFADLRVGERSPRH